MDKQDLIKYIDRINLTGPGGRDKIKKILMDFAINGAGGGGDDGGGGGGGGDDPTPTPTPSGLGKYVYYGGANAEIPINSSTSSIIGSFSKSKNSVISNVPSYTKYYYISLPISYHLSRVVTENNENITELFTAKGAYTQESDSYILYEFHLSSDMPMNVNITITVTE